MQNGILQKRKKLLGEKFGKLINLEPFNDTVLQEN